MESLDVAELGRSESVALRPAAGVPDSVLSTWQVIGDAIMRVSMDSDQKEGWTKIREEFDVDKTSQYASKCQDHLTPANSEAPRS